MKEFEITEVIIREAIYIHRTLGPGLLEEVYKKCLAYRLKETGFSVTTESPIPVWFEQVKMDVGYRADIIVENKVLIELKCAEALTEVHKSIVLTHLKFSGLKVGLLFNFHALILKDGMKRLLNNYMENKFLAG